MGIVLVSLGGYTLYAQTANMPVTSLLPVESQAIIIGIVVFGAISLAIAFFGCCGSVNESRILLSVVGSPYRSSGSGGGGGGADAHSHTRTRKHALASTVLALPGGRSFGRGWGGHFCASGTPPNGTSSLGLVATGSREE